MLPLTVSSCVLLGGQSRVPLRRNHHIHDGLTTRERGSYPISSGGHMTKSVTDKLIDSKLTVPVRSSDGAPRQDHDGRIT